MKTLIILGHPHLENSKLNSYIKERISILSNVDYKIIDKVEEWDIKKEQKEIESYDQILFQYPIYWMAMPGELKMYFDKVFNNKWSYGSRFALKDKKVGFIRTSGNSKKTYYLSGLNPFGPKIMFFTTTLSMKFMKLKPQGVVTVYKESISKKDNNIIDRIINKFNLS